MEKKNYKKQGVIGTVVFHVIVLLALIFMALRTPLPLPGEEGVEVSLGDAETGSGLVQREKLQPVQRMKPILPQPEQEKIIQQTIEEAPKLEEEIVEKTEHEEVKTEEKPPEKIEEEPKVNPNALYTPHKTDNKQSGNEGENQNLADQGKETGSDKSKKRDGESGLGDGVSFDLEGRGSVHLPKPAYESLEQGKIVVAIWVNKYGKVTKAIEGVKGSTISDLTLRKLTRNAALQAKFSPDPNAPEEQRGTITYNFVRIH